MRKILIIFLLLYSTLILANQKSDCIYVNSFSCSEISNGSMEHPFKKLDDLTKIIIQSGTCIYLSGNQVFEGSIKIAGVLSDDDKPLTISSYGSGTAQIFSSDSSAVIIENCKNVKIHNLTVKGSGRKVNQNGTGISVINSSFVQIDRIEASGYQMNGIGITGGSNVRITNSYAHNNGYNGIEITDKWGTKNVRNVYIGYCIAENNAGNPKILDNHSGSGILVGHATNALVEYCEAMNNGWDMPRSGNGPVGIWGYESDSLIIQYCYSHHNKSSFNGLDGGGFDFDGGITNSVMQYNLSMNNEGAGYGLFQFGGATEWTNNVIRNNVSINDGIKNSQSGIYVWCASSNKNKHLTNSVVHDNLIVNDIGYGVNFNTGFSTNLKFSDNKFLLLKNGKEVITGDNTRNMALFDQNIYWSESAELKGKPQPKIKMDKKGIYQKIKFAFPGNIEVLRIKEIVTSLLSD